MISVTDLRAGIVFKDSQGVWEVSEYRHIKIGRGGATIRIKVKNLKTGATLEKTFNSGQRVEDVEVIKRKGQFLYSDANAVVFMDPGTFEQFSLAKGVLEGKEAFLQEGGTYNLLGVEDQVLAVELPKLVVLKVAETGPGVKGDTVSNAYKDAALENGLKIKVPLFVKSGDLIKVDTRSKEYVERVR
ncbi:MAG: elongation factor P [Candidatus Woykebacteria bacterium GWA1_44_8]|uniref:Elongation factor P n=1 Tax=Candidatus Woykebacteria bacterium GWA1_44_8 TaxID=1802591 RepID=A0A1G1W398_9BACT|nr:MAG: elongation factor P [Candidatus Woykebacteria bacterium GWA1_44_8]